MALAARTRPEDKPIPGGAILSRLLAAEGVDRVFGIIDGSYFGLYSTLPDHGIELITPRHEATAVDMAGAWARLTGRLGVCMASNGPGVANALSGVAVEQAEGNRVLLLTSSRRAGITHPDRGGTFQCFPQVEAIRAMSKWSESAPTVDRVPELFRKALRASFDRRPGVVHLDVPESVLNASTEPDPGWFREPAGYRLHAPPEPAAASVEEAARLLAEAERPLIHAGSGVVHALAYRELRQVAERLHAPITTSWGARTALDERHELAVPMIYVGANNQARNEADLVLVLGSRLGETDWWGKAPYWAADGEQRIVQVDLDPEVIGNHRSVALGVQADVGVFLRRLREALEDARMSLAGRRRWATSLRRACAKRRKQLDRKVDRGSMPLHSGLVPATCREVFGDDAIFVLDGGNTSVWGHFYLEVRQPGTLLTTAKMGMLGAGVAQALAAQVAHPDRRVCCLTGDGAMGFHPQEVETAVRNGLPVVFVVFCDRQWGMVKVGQQIARRPLKTIVRGTLPVEETLNTELSEIAFDQLGRAMGAYGERVADPAGFSGALERALATGRPSVVHVDVDPIAHLWAPELKTFRDMHLEPGQ